MTDPPSLHPGRIDLWCAFFDEVQDCRLLERYRELLTEEERRQQARFVFPADRHRYLVTRALVRTTLSQYAPVAPEQWSFSPNPFGRPEIANDDAASGRVSFNLSHTKSLIVLGVTCDNALGVDVENVHVRRAACEVADRFFSPVEVGALRALPPEGQHQRFFEYWTLKESYIKARGMGLSIPLDQFHFNFQGERQVSISLAPELNDRSARWRFWQLQPSAHHLVALCVERSDHPTPQLEIRKVVPFLSEESIECPILRTSD